MVRAAVLFFVVVTMGAVIAAHAEPRLALLIGNEAYAERVGPLKHPHDDIALVGAALESLGFKVTRLENLSHGAMDAAIKRYADELRRAGAGATGFFYYSGHGAANPENKVNYLIPVDVADAGSEELWYQSIEQSAVIDRLSRQAPGAAHIVVFDACRNELNLRGAAKGLGDDKGFAPVNEVRGMLIAYATAENRTASDTGAFARILAEELPKKVEAVAMFRDVQLRAQREMRQEPWMSLRYLPELYLAGREAGPTVLSSAPMQRLQPEKSPTETNREPGIPKSLDEYLSIYPYPRKNADVRQKLTEGQIYRAHASELRSKNLSASDLIKTLLQNEDLIIRSKLKTTQTIEHNVIELGTQHLFGSNIRIFAAASKPQGSECHACGVLLSLFELKDTFGSLSVGSISVGVGYYGSWGSAPDLSLLPLGLDRYGIMLLSSYTAQGEISESKTLIAPIGGTYFDVFSEETGENNGASGATEYNSWETKFDFVAAGGFLPKIYAQKAGEKKNQKFQETSIFQFDGYTGKYTVRPK